MNNNPVVKFHYTLLPALTKSEFALQNTISNNRWIYTGLDHKSAVVDIRGYMNGIGLVRSIWGNYIQTDLLMIFFLRKSIYLSIYFDK